MKKVFLLFALIAFNTVSFAHMIWIETNATGKVNQKQQLKVYFGEYAEGLTEKTAGDSFKKVAKFTLWAVAPNGEKTKLETTAAADCYTAYFIPKTNGTYTIVVDNNEIDVLDFTKYNFGIFKPHYHCVTKVVVGTKSNETAAINPEGLTIVDISKTLPTVNGEVTLQLLYKGAILKDKEVDLLLKDHWSKKVKTDANGQIKFSLPWNTTYIAEVTNKEEVPGSYNGKEYQFIWHSTTYTIIVK